MGSTLMGGSEGVAGQALATAALAVHRLCSSRSGATLPALPAHTSRGQGRDQPSGHARPAASLAAWLPASLAQAKGGHPPAISQLLCSCTTLCVLS